MNTSILVRSFLFETQLVARSAKESASPVFRKDLDECIASTVRMLKVQNRKYTEVLKGPGVVTSEKYPPAFLKVWKARADSTVKMIDRFLGTSDMQKRSVLHRDLTRRGFLLPAPQPVRPRFRTEVDPATQFKTVPTGD